MNSQFHLLCAFTLLTACCPDLDIHDADSGIDGSVETGPDANSDTSSCGDGPALTSLPRCDDPEFWSARPSLCYAFESCGGCESSLSQFMRPECVIPFAVDMSDPVLVCAETVDANGTHYRSFTEDAQDFPPGFQPNVPSSVTVWGHRSLRSEVRLRAVFRTARGFEFSEGTHSFGDSSPPFYVVDSSASQVAVGGAIALGDRVAIGRKTVDASQPQDLVAMGTYRVQWVEAGAVPNIATWVVAGGDDNGEVTREAVSTLDTPRLLAFPERRTSAWVYEETLAWSDSAAVSLPSRPDLGVLVHLGPRDAFGAPWNLALVAIYDGLVQVTMRDGETFETGAPAAHVVRGSVGAWLVREGTLYSLDLDDAGDLVVGERTRPLLVDEAGLLVVMEDGRQISRTQVAVPDNPFGPSVVRLDALFDGEVIDAACSPTPNSNLRCSFLVRRAGEMGVMEWVGPPAHSCGF